MYSPKCDKEYLIFSPQQILLIFCLFTYIWPLWKPIKFATRQISSDMDFSFMLDASDQCKPLQYIIHVSGFNQEWELSICVGNLAITETKYLAYTVQSRKNIILILYFRDLSPQASSPISFISVSRQKYHGRSIQKTAVCRMAAGKQRKQSTKEGAGADAVSKLMLP